jgi:Tfp pilus assembly protein PilO
VKGYWENLRPFERRVIVVVGVFFFLVLNYLFVFPYFREWSQLHRRMDQANVKKKLYDNVLTQTNVIWREVQQMERAGLDIPAEDQVRHFANTIDAQAGKSGVNLITVGRSTQSTNQFFIELTRSITAQSPEQPLVDFLFSLGSGNSLIRVRDLNLRPEPNRQQLMANITLAASYQKKSAARPASPPASGPGSKPPAAQSTQPSNPIKK